MPPRRETQRTLHEIPVAAVAAFAACNQITDYRLQITGQRIPSGAQTVIMDMTIRLALAIAVTTAALGCGMSDQDLHDRTGRAAVSVKQAAEGASNQMKAAYDSAAMKGKEAMDTAGAKLSDAALRGKVLAGFKLVAGLEAKDIEVEAKEGKIYLSGSVPTQLDKMKAEGVAFGVTGARSKYESTIVVK